MNTIVAHLLSVFRVRPALRVAVVVVVIFFVLFFTLFNSGLAQRESWSRNNLRINSKHDTTWITSGTGVAGEDSAPGGGATFGSSVLGDATPLGSGVMHSASVLGVDAPDAPLRLPAPLARGTDS